MSDEKKLLYILIGSGPKPLASYSIFTGDFIQTCESYLKQVTPKASASVNCGDFYIYYMNQDNITYLIMTGTTFPKATAIGCLDSLKKELSNSLVGRNFDNILEYGLSEELKQKLQMKFEFFNENTDVSSETVQNIKNEMMKMKDEVFNANKELHIRGEKLSEMEDKAEKLKDASSSYKQGAIKVRKETSKRKIMIYIGLILAVLVIIYVIVAIACDSWTFDCGSDE